MFESPFHEEEYCWLNYTLMQEHTEMMFHNRPFKREVSGIAKARKKDLAWGDDKVISKNNSAEVNVLIKGDKLQVKVNFLSVFHIVLFVAG